MADWASALGGLGTGLLSGMAERRKKERDEDAALQKELRLFERQSTLQGQRERAASELADARDIRAGQRATAADIAKEQRAETAASRPFGDVLTSMEVTNPTLAARFKPGPMPEAGTPAEHELQPPPALQAPPAVHKDLLPFLLTKPERPGMSPAELMHLLREGGGEGGGLEPSFSVPLAGGGTASLKRRPSEKPAALTDFSTAAALVRSRTPGLPADPNQWPPEALEAVRNEVARLSGARSEQRIILSGSPEAVAAQARLDTARMRARKAVGLEYLPLEVRARTQEQINVATDPANIAAVARKIEAEATARTGGGPLDADTRQVTGAMQSAIAVMHEMRREFTPEQRRDFVGILRNPALRAAQFVRGDPQFARFSAMLGRLKKAAFEDDGKQMTQFEFSVVQQYVPQGTEMSWEDFEAKLELGAAYSQMIIDARRQMAGATKGGFAREGLPQPALPARGGAPGAAPGKPPDTRVIDGKTYRKIDGKWYQQ